MDDRGRRARAGARQSWPVRVYRLGEEPGDDLSAITTAEEPIAMSSSSRKEDPRIAALQARIDDLETYCSHLATALFAALPLNDAPQRANYARLAIMVRFSARDEERLDDFLRWAFAEHQRGALTRDRLLAEYERTMPEHLRGKLEQILAAHRDDGTYEYCVATFFAGA